jgi:hypothetical protein
MRVTFSRNLRRYICRKRRQLSRRHGSQYNYRTFTMKRSALRRVILCYFIIILHTCVCKCTLWVTFPDTFVCWSAYCGICGGPSGIAEDFSPSTSISHTQSSLWTFCLTWHLVETRLMVMMWALVKWRNNGDQGLQHTWTKTYPTAY